MSIKYTKIPKIIPVIHVYIFKRFFLYFRGTLATRHKPSGEALKSQILKRQNLHSKDNSPVPDSLPKLPILKPDKKAKDAKVSLLADLQKLQRRKCDSEDEKNINAVTSDNKDLDKINNNNIQEECGSSSDSNKNTFLTELKNIKNSKPKIKVIKEKEPNVIQDQLRLKLEARKKHVDESNEVKEE